MKLRAVTLGILAATVCWTMLLLLPRPVKAIGQDTRSGSVTITFYGPSEPGGTPGGGSGGGGRKDGSPSKPEQESLVSVLRPDAVDQLGPLPVTGGRDRTGWTLLLLGMGLTASGAGLSARLIPRRDSGEGRRPGTEK